MANPEHLALLMKGVEAWNEWRRAHRDIRPNLIAAGLSGADLSRADLSGAYLSEAHLDDADLSAVDLSDAYLAQADLARARLRGALLERAVLNSTDLYGANLCKANLISADLGGAKLVETNLGGARLGETILSDTLLALSQLSGLDLSRARGLATVDHRGPSAVGTDTLELTAAGLTRNPSKRGKVEAFLRGAGVSQRYMEAFGYSIGQAIEFYSCFISYSAEDKPFARRLYDALQGRGVRCWLDEHQMLPGDDIYEQIDRGIRLWDKVLLCCSKASLTSWWVEREIEKALKKERDIRKQQDRSVLALIPLALDESLFSWESGKASVILERHAADFTGYQTDSARFDEQFERVVKALRTDESKRERPPESKL